MEKLSGKTTTISVFISGRGTNLESLINFSKIKKNKIKINLVVSNNKNAKIINIAKKNNIKYVIINYKDKKEAEKKILKILKQKNIEFICLAGFMKILSKKFINNYKNKILNIHPSLLPKYKGLNTHKRVILNKETFTGCTVHIVNFKLDSGKIILQKKVKLSKKETPSSLQKKILKYEHNLYPRAISKIFANL